MADYTYMTEEISDNYSSFSIDNNLTPDSFVVLEDLPANQIANVTRLNDLKKKTALTSDEQTEYDTLLSALLPYMPTSDILNKYIKLQKWKKKIDIFFFFLKKKRERKKNKVHVRLRTCVTYVHVQCKNCTLNFLIKAKYIYIHFYLQSKF